MSNGFSTAALKNVIVPVERPEIPDIEKTYRQVGVRLWGEGAYERETISGDQTKYSTLSQVKANDIIVNKIWARNGSVAVISSSLDGCYVSGEFPTFEPIEGKLYPRWFHWLTKTRDFWAQCNEKSRGTSGKNRIRPEKFLEIEIPLPPLEEQRRIVARIEELAVKIEEARGLQRDLLTNADALCRSLIFTNEELELTSMKELVSLRETDVSVDPNENYNFAGIYSFGQGMFRGQQKKGMEFAYTRLTRLKTDNFTYPKLMAWEGALAVVPSECDGFVVSPEFPVFQINQELVLPETLDIYFRTPSVWPVLSGVSTGTNVRRRRLNPSDFLAFKMPLPPMKTQLLLRGIKARVDALKRMQAESSAELNALLPSILDKAFRGEL